MNITSCRKNHILIHANVTKFTKTLLQKYVTQNSKPYVKRSVVEDMIIFKNGKKNIIDNFRIDNVDLMSEFLKKNNLEISTYSRTLLFHACNYGLINIIKFLYPRYYETVNKEGLLMQAIENQYNDIAKYLINFSLETGSKELFYVGLEVACEKCLMDLFVFLTGYETLMKINFDDAIIIAYHNGHDDIFKLIPITKVTDFTFNKILMKAISEKKTEYISYLVSCIDPMQDLKGNDLLRTCIEVNDFATLRLLMEKLNFSNHQLSQALCIACKHGIIEIVKYLVVKGADIDFKIESVTTKSPLLSALKCDHDNRVVIEYLLKKVNNYKGCEEIIFEHIAKKGDSDFLMYVMKLGMKPFDHTGNLLNIAFVNHNKSIYEYLTKINTNNYDFLETLESIICDRGDNLATIKYIFDNFYSQNYCQPCLETAARYSKIKIFNYVFDKYFTDITDIDKLLIHACSSVDIMTPTTTLSVSNYSKHSCLKIVETLIKNGANINASNGTPLNTCFIMNPCVFKYLIIKGAKIDLLVNECAREILKVCTPNNIFKLLHDKSLNYVGEAGYYHNKMELGNYNEYQLNYPYDYTILNINYKYYDSLTLE